MDVTQGADMSYTLSTNPEWLVVALTTNYTENSVVDWVQGVNSQCLSQA